MKGFRKRRKEGVQEKKKGRGSGGAERKKFEEVYKGRD